MSDETAHVPRRELLKYGFTAMAVASHMPVGATLLKKPKLTKSISIIMRKSRLSRSAFLGHWLGEHGPGARQVPELNGFVLGEVVADPARGRDAGAPPLPIDGITESWQPAGVRRAEQAKTNPHVREWLAAAPRYIGALDIFSTREHFFAPPVRSGLKVMTLISRRKDMTRKAFVRHMLEVHGPLSEKVPGLRGYVLSEVVNHVTMPGIPSIPGLHDIDMIGESWLSTDPDERTPDTPERRAWLADGAAHFGPFLRFVTQDHIFVPPPY
ncbi:EthD domain-containing protein [Pacificimonas sp. ICDLI1SI03]